MTREEAIEYFENVKLYMLVHGGARLAVALDTAIKALEQEPKTGHWITQWNAAHQKEYYYCSECREEFSYNGETGIKMNNYSYCPNCGAKMAEPQESEK